MKPITPYLKQDKQVLLIQARINAAALKQLRLKLKTEHVTIKEFVEAAIKAYLDETA